MVPANTNIYSYSKLIFLLIQMYLQEHINHGYKYLANILHLGQYFA